LNQKAERLSVRESEFHSHVTIAKMSRFSHVPRGDREELKKLNKQIPQSCYVNHTESIFGTDGVALPFNELQLCAMVGEKSDDFYPVVATCLLSGVGWI